MAPLAITLLLLLSGCGKAKEDVSFPCQLAEDSLSVTSLFQYSGDNPDCGGQAGEEIASLAVTNQSEKHLASAKLTAKLADGTKRVFQLADIPAGQTVWVFAQDNGSFTSSNTCKELKCEASFAEEPPFLADQVAVETEGISVTLTNLTDEDLAGLTVYCHCLMGLISVVRLTRIPWMAFPRESASRSRRRNAIWVKQQLYG